MRRIPVVITVRIVHGRPQSQVASFIAGVRRLNAVRNLGDVCSILVRCIGADCRGDMELPVAQNRSIVQNCASTP